MQLVELNLCKDFCFCIVEAKNISDEQKEKIQELIKKGGQVCMDHFENGWIRNPIVATIWHNDDLVACGALKVPCEKYKKKVFLEKAHSDFPFENIKYELGWIVTDKIYRCNGFCNNIVKFLLHYNDYECYFKPNYATTQQNNQGMQKILISNGFCESGVPYKSECGEYNLQLFVRNMKQNIL